MSSSYNRNGIGGGISSSSSSGAGGLPSTRIDNKRTRPSSQSLLDLSHETEEKRRRMIVEIALLRMEIRRKEKAKTDVRVDEETGRLRQHSYNTTTCYRTLTLVSCHTSQ